MSNKKSFYGIGHCIVDYFAPKTSEAVFSALNQKSPLHLEEKEFFEIFSQVKPSIKKTGGTTANILKTIGKLGEKCVFTGAAGSSDGKLDEDGEFFQGEMSKIGVECQLFTKDASTGGFLWISKDDGERLIAVNVGAAKQLEASQINESRFSNSWCFIMEGMQFLNQHIVERVVDLCFRYNVPLVVDCGTLFGAEAVGKVLLDVSHSVDIILFANENEISVLVALLLWKSLEKRAQNFILLVKNFSKKQPFLLKSLTVLLSMILELEMLLLVDFYSLFFLNQKKHF